MDGCTAQALTAVVTAALTVALTETCWQEDQKRRQEEELTRKQRAALTAALTEAFRQEEQKRRQEEELKRKQQAALTAALTEALRQEELEHRQEEELKRKQQAALTAALTEAFVQEEQKHRQEEELKRKQPAALTAALTEAFWQDEQKRRQAEELKRKQQAALTAALTEACWQEEQKRRQEEELKRRQQAVGMAALTELLQQEEQKRRHEEELKRIPGERKRKLDQALADALSQSSRSAHGTLRHGVLAPLISKILCQEDAATTLRFVPETSRAYSLQPLNYGLRGNRPYYKPIGWIRYSVKLDNFKKYEDWCIAYHGTKSKNATAILANGLRCPTRPEEIAHGQCGGNGRTIYLSHSTEYAAHPVYSQFVELSSDHWAQLVIECRVQPGSFVEQGNTLGDYHRNRKVPFDDYFAITADIEWLVNCPKSVIVSGVDGQGVWCGIGSRRLW